MRKIIIFFLLFSSPLFAEDFKLEKILSGFDKPWSLSFVDNKNILINEKSGKIKLFNLDTKIIKNISHNLNILEDGQGGLLDVVYKNNLVFVSYSENRSKGMSSTSVARAVFNKQEMSFKNILELNHQLIGYHFGSRLAIQGDHLYITAGEEEKV